MSCDAIDVLHLKLMTEQFLMLDIVTDIHPKYGIMCFTFSIQA